MARPNKKVLGLELEKIIDEEFAKFEEFLPSPQDVAVYRRKRREYMDAINARLKEGGASDGRDDDSGERDNGSDGSDGSI